MYTRICTAALLAVLAAGCVSQPVAPTAATVAAEVKPGQQVHLLTRDGTEGDYRVVRVGAEALFVKPRGQDRRKDSEQSIAYRDILELSVSRTNKSAVATGLVVAAVLGGGIVLTGAMEAAAAAALCC